MSRWFRLYYGPEFIAGFHYPTPACSNSLRAHSSQVYAKPELWLEQAGIGGSAVELSTK